MYKLTTEIEYLPNERIEYKVICKDVDVDVDVVATYIFPMSRGLNNLLHRFNAAIAAGAAIKVDGVATNAIGKSYLLTTATVRARYLNADLKALGF